MTKTQLITSLKNKSVSGKGQNNPIKNFNYSKINEIHDMFKYWTVDQL